MKSDTFRESGRERDKGEIILGIILCIIACIVVIAPGLSILYLTIQLTDDIPIIWMGFFGGIMMSGVLNEIFKPAEFLG